MRALATLFVSALVAAAGCAYIFDADELPLGDAGAPIDAAAALDGALVPDVLAPIGCELAAPPARPTERSATGGEELVFAFDTFKLSTSRAEGFDLDGRCTCAPDAGALSAPSCVPPQGTATACDGEGGRDNAAAALAESIFLGGKPLDLGYDDSVREGRGATLLQLTQYSGAPDDDAVEVAVYDSPGTEPQVPCPTGTVVDAGLADGGKVLPGYGGCDVWSRSTDSVVVGGVPKVRTNLAWVRGGVLVAKFDVLVLTPGPVTISMYDVVLVGTLVAGAPRKLQGVKIAGRISARDVLRVFGERRPRPELPPLCVDEANLTFVKTKVCAALDLPTQVVTQVVPTCDSMSFVFEGSAVAARLGAEAPPSPPPSGCADAGDYAKCP
jgi:hypothetical protein